MTASSVDAHDGGDDACCGSGIAIEPPSARALRDGMTFKVAGLDCVEEVAILRREIGPLVGGDARLAFDVINGRMTVLPEAGGVTPDAVVAAVARTGMRAEPWSAGGGADVASEDRRRRIQALLTGLSGASLVAGFAIHVWISGGFGQAIALFAAHAGQPVPLPEIVAYALSIAFGARYVVVKAWFAAKRLRPDMNLLMVIAITGAVGIGEWFEAAAVAFLFALSLMLESWSVGRARRAIAALLDLTPPTVRLKPDIGPEREVPAAEVPVGARFVVRPGERIPLDGRVVAGASAVDQAPITGESVPVAKEIGSEVYAGTVNGEGAIEVESSKAAGDTTLAQIIRLVAEAHGRRAAAEQWVEKFARVYTPLVIVFAIAVALLPPLAFDAAWEVWFYRALVLLVIACPCALVISTPVSIVSALAAAARNGVLVKGGIFIEAPAHLKALAFDKTGTLTMGKPAVVGVHPLNEHGEDDLLARAAALEARSNHPLARAILAYAETRGVAPEPAAEVVVLPGKGVTGLYGGTPFWLGSHRYLMERGQATPAIERAAEDLAKAGRTVIAIGNDDHVCGLIAVADQVRPEAAAVVRSLREAGIDHIAMLTGDNRATAEAIARQAGVDQVHAELLPADKVAVIEDLVARYGKVAMLGDGVNDAPALGRADLGIAMGAMGSDAAIETADIALMSDDIAKLPWLIGHARRTLFIIHQNITFALAVKVVFAALTLFGHASLWAAIAADVGASLLVVMNGLRLLRARVGNV